MLKYLPSLLQDSSKAFEDGHRGKQESRKWKWARPEADGTPPCARGGHSATLINRAIYVFGGHHYAGQACGFKYFNDLSVLDIENNSWLHPVCRGTAPGPRYGHSACLVGTRIVIFGGRGPKNRYYRDLHAFDTTTRTWYQGPKSSGLPTARFGHTGDFHESHIYIFGGATKKLTSPDSPELLGDLHQLDMSTMDWSPCENQGTPPCPRFGHASTIVENHLIIHGGLCRTSPASPTLSLDDWYLADIRTLDLVSKMWFRVRFHGTPPSRRYGHTLTTALSNIIVFGGWTPLAKERNATTATEKSGTSTTTMSSSTNHWTHQQKSAFPFSESQQKDRYSIKSPPQIVDRSWLAGAHVVMALDTIDKTWKTCDTDGLMPDFLYGHTCTAIGPHLVIFGGWDGIRPLNEILVFQDRTEDSCNAQISTPQPFAVTLETHTEAEEM